MSKPIITAIVSTYNSEEFVAGCIEDLEAQTIADQLEIIVIDSCSDQNEKEKVIKLQFKYNNLLYLRTPTREGIYKAWNRGIGVASGKYITNANTDDRHAKDALERMAAILEAQPKIGVVYADSYITETKNATFDNAPVKGRFYWPTFDRKVLFDNCIIGPAPVWRKDIHYKHGLFDESMLSAGDYEFWLRISDKVKFEHITDPLGLYYWSPESVEHKNANLSIREAEIARSRYWNYPQKRTWHGQSYAVEGKEKEAPVYAKKQDDVNKGDLVSVIMPTLNRPNQLRLAIQSVAEQTYHPIELVVINDGGCFVSDVISDFVRHLDIKLIENDANYGTSHARNRGMEAAKGKFICFLDDDDLYYPPHIQTLINAWYSEGGKLSGVYADALQVNLIMGDNGPQERSRSVAWSSDFSRDTLLVSNYIPNLCFMTTKEISLKVGGFDETLEALEDWEFLIKCALVGRFKHIKQTTAQYHQNWGLKTRNILSAETKIKLFETIYTRYWKNGNEKVRQERQNVYNMVSGAELKISQ
jgi:glycosyltransferase involved in cell wall biosynthesis